MSLVKKTSLLLFRLALASIAMLIAYILSTMVMGQTNTSMTPEETSRAVQALPLVSMINALVLSYPILRSRWHGLKLIGAVSLVQFGVETFVAQLETLYYHSAIQMGIAEFVGIVAAGALRALVFAPLAVFVFARMKKSTQPEEKKTAATPSEWGKRSAALAVFYVIVYFVFGYFVAWQWVETRLFYSGTPAIKPFFIHFWDLFSTEPIILPFQVLRGALWTTLAIVIVRMMKAKRWEASLAVALTFAALLSSAIGLFPNPYMPPMVCQAHFFELSSSMLVFGGIAGWVMYKKG